jgi:Fur family ferric uptake transcriptional regulator
LRNRTHDPAAQRDRIQRGRGRPAAAAARGVGERAAPGLSIATVYRQFKALVNEGVLCPVQLTGEAPRNEPSAQG